MTTPALIESLDFEGHGIARVDGKTIFIDGGLPRESVSYKSYRIKPRFENAEATQIHTSSHLRVNPPCPHFGSCGGCSMQHMEFSGQVAAKQRVLEDNLKRIGNIKPEMLLPAIYGPEWGYRQRARLSVSVRGNEVRLGFFEKRSKIIADLKECHVLPPHISKQILPLRQLIKRLSIKENLLHIELAVGEHVDILVLRTPIKPNKADQALLKTYADEWKVQFWLQAKSSEAATVFYPNNAPQLSYSIPEFGIVMRYKPTEFTQVNHLINRTLVARAMGLLDPQPNEVIADFFCGVGNFTLPIARSGAKTLGMEGLQQLVDRANESAADNQLASNTQFKVANLFEMTESWLKKLGHFDKMLIDPPRDGAHELCKSISAQNGPQRIVYVSCNPATLARDADVLVHEKGYVLKAAGIVNMFPHTAHVESIAWFEKAE
ncbi:23S rRNA (uracil(1939)-C(5))-methyltransferase RlmD [Iodobacter fluviatilis]|uniref:23S rRNA (uracil(1939)-C(5))-methyltransferase RlmD n=1 Tax=Iodobacter fluviatilis TaxID=537 RepID=A0A7G3G6T8_9NEIS|nr:23S rRNA (uracil(1939)-C(5))-methyltransferase RlmD [Iodobacter fluviatilis]QBC42733.1 23S rRNA (uracil(1939)-C(5))-methyltransferase RlmD [Iodobacter fluviatilis]